MTKINNYDNATITCRSFADWEADPKKISIPILQREFTWKEEELSEIYDDYLKAYRNFKQRTGIGVIYLTEDDEKREIIDGQQRITSYYLLKTTIKLILKKDHSYFSRFTSEHQMLNRAYQTVAYQTDFKKPKQIAHCPNCGAEMDLCESRFGKYYRCTRFNTVGCEGTLSIAKYEKSIVQNNEILQGITNFEHLIKTHDLPKPEDNFFDGQNYSVEKLEDFLQFLNEKVHFVEYVLTDDDHASEFFEKLNSRGKGLEAIELIQVFMRRTFKQSSDAITNVFEDLYTMFPTNTNLSTKNDLLRDALVSFIHLQYGKQIKTKASEQKAIARQVRSFFEEYKRTGMDNEEFRLFLVKYHQYAQIVYYIDKEKNNVPDEIKNYFTPQSASIIAMCKNYKYEKLLKTVVSYGCLENKFDRSSNGWVKDRKITREIMQAITILKVRSMYVDQIFNEKSVNRSLNVIGIEKTFRNSGIETVIETHFEDENVFQNYGITFEDALEQLSYDKKNKDIISIAKRAFKN